MTAILVIKDTDTNTTAKNPDNFVVILHNDPITPFRVVIQALIEAANASQGEAENIMWTAHTTGKAVVIVCDLERAEFVTDQLSIRGLTVSMEKE